MSILSSTTELMQTLPPPSLPPSLLPYLATVELPVINKERERGERQQRHGQDGIENGANDMGDGEEGGAACFPAANSVVDEGFEPRDEKHDGDAGQDLRGGREGGRTGKKRGVSVVFLGMLLGLLCSLFSVFPPSRPPSLPPSLLTLPGLR